MKKIFIILTFIFLMPINVYADGLFDDQHFSVCYYKYKASSTAPAIAIYDIKIYYNFEKKEWQIDWGEKGVTAHHGSKKGKFNFVFSTKKINVKINDTNKNKLKAGECPSGAWMYSDGFTSRVCLGSKKECDIKQKEASSEKTYDFIEYHKNDDLIPDLGTCDDLRNKNLNIKDKLIENVKQMWFGGNDIPEFVNSNKTYQQLLNGLETKINILKIKCDNEVKNDSNLSDEEKEKALKENQKGIENAKDQVKTYKSDTKSNTYNIEVKDLTCDDLTKGSFGGMLKQILSFVRYLVPLIILALSIKDFIGVMAAQDASAMKKTIDTFIKRLIIGAVIFLLPTIIDILLKMAGIECGLAGFFGS